MRSDRDREGTTPPKLVLAAMVALAIVGLAAVWVVAWVPIWPCTLLEHFRVQYVVTGVALLGLAAVLHMRVWFDVVAIATLLHWVVINGDLTASPPEPVDGVAIRVLVLNVETANRSFEQVRRLIADEKPDVIGLVEVDSRWSDGVAAAVHGFEKIEARRSDNFGVALYARGQLRGRAESLGTELPTIVADAEVRGARLQVVLTHPLPPMNAAAVEMQERQFAAVAERVRTLAAPVIVMRGFNATPWSRLFVRLATSTGLCDSRAGFGVGASFPTLTSVLRIPIDHLLASCSVGVRDRRIGPDVGSDHLPVIVDLVIPK